MKDDTTGRALFGSVFFPGKMGNQGMALISSILLLLVLTFVGATVIVLSTTDLQIVSNYKTSTQSFYNADAGVQYALRQLKNSSLTSIPAVAHYSAPSTAIFPLLSNGKIPFSPWTTVRLELKPGTTTDYRYTSTGYYGNSEAKIEATVRFTPFQLVKGMMGWKEVKFEDSTLNGLGSTPPVIATNGGSSKLELDTVTGSITQKINAGMSTDPLNVASLIAAKATSNDNNKPGTTGISGTKFASSDVTLKPGDYYITDLNDLKTLTISPTGKVNIYIPAGVHIELDQVGTNINTGGSAGNLSIFTSTTEDIKLAGNFTGMIYAPNAEIKIEGEEGHDHSDHSSASVTTTTIKGALWAEEIKVEDTTLNFTYDSTVESGFGGASTLYLLSWKQL